MHREPIKPPDSGPCTSTLPNPAVPSFFVTLAQRRVDIRYDVVFALDEHPLG